MMSNLPFNIPVIVEQPLQAGRNLIIPTVVREVNQLSRQFALQHIQIIQPKREEFNIPDNQNPPDPQLYLSLLGTKVLVDLTFQGQTYQNELGQTFTFPDITLETVLLSINQTKNIVKTSIQGRRGTIKEYIGLGDYELNINLIIAGANGVYPKSDVQDMITMLECPDPITVTSWYLAMFKIFSVVINSYDHNQDEGQYSRQAISITASSDDEVNLRFRP